MKITHQFLPEVQAFVQSWSCFWYNQSLSVYIVPCIFYRKYHSTIERKLIDLSCRWNPHLIILCVALKVSAIKHMYIGHVSYITCPFCDARDSLYFYITYVDIYLQKVILFLSVWRFQKLLYSHSRHPGFGCFFNAKKFF